MSLENTAKQIKKSSNSMSSIHFLLASVEKLAKEKKGKGEMEFYGQLHTLQEVFVGAENTSPSNGNILNYLAKGTIFSGGSPEGVLEKISQLRKYLVDSEKKMALLGEKKIKEGGSVFVFGQDTFVSKILKHARSKGKGFEVHNTEMRPNFYGRKFAGELTKGGIRVNHYADSSLKLAISSADIILCDCVSILSNGDVLGSAGFDLVADVALNAGVPLYVCAPSWKADFGTFLGQNPQNYLKSLWAGAPKGVKLNSPLFDKVNSKLLTGVISELGIYRSDVFMDEVRYENQWGG